MNPVPAKSELDFLCNAPPNFSAEYYLALVLYAPVFFRGSAV